MPAKRKVPSLGLERRVRPRREDEWEPEVNSDEELSSDDAASEEGIGGGDDDSDQEEEMDSEMDSDAGSESEESDSDDKPKIDLSSVSFGALARAQATLAPSDRKAKRQKTEESTEVSTRGAPTRTSKAKADKPSRSSKHAPQEMTSKRPVSRHREIIADTKRKHRDPRFDPLIGGRGADDAKVKKAYSFLDEYRDSEMADLRVQIKKTKDAGRKEELKRQLMSMESKRKARKRKEDEERLIKEHRQKEKALVAQGKQPFYLKKSEQKKQMLVDRFSSMSKGQVDKAIERRRKKVASKEKKELISMERVRDRH